MPNFTPNGYHCDLGRVSDGSITVERLNRDFVLFFTKYKLPKAFVHKTEHESRVQRNAANLAEITRKYV